MYVACTYYIAKFFDFVSPSPIVTVTLTQLISTVICFLGTPPRAEIMCTCPLGENLSDLWPAFCSKSQKIIELFPKLHATPPEFGGHLCYNSLTNQHN